MIDNHFPVLLEQMQQPEFYPHSVQKPIAVIQTHASVVFLTGDYAYKLKKPVDFVFLDYSTLDKRHYFLNRELHLNQPVAPEIYLEVLPITQSDNNWLLAGIGKPLEYVLKMAQFPQESLLINLLKEGRLTEFHIKELGRIVAQFHRQAASNEYIRSFGEVEKIKKTIDENYKQTEKYIGISQNRQQYDEIRKFTDDFLSKHGALFKGRQETGKIKECHGDLHLKNICWWHDKIQLFDRIEFNESFQFVDVMYDIAFTVMDLEARGRRDFSNLFLNIYLEQTGDWEGLQVLPLYLSRQAYVRAKVTSMLLDDQEISPQQKQEAIAMAADYYRLAWEYTQKTPGKLLIMSGLSGSGKTTVARELARRMGGIHLRSDAVRKHLAGLSLDCRGGRDIYTSEMNKKTYNRLLELGEILIREGYTVILDAKFDLRMWRKRAIDIAKACQVDLKIIHCTAPLEVLNDRLQKRIGDISDATPSLLVQQQETAESFTEEEQTYAMIVDTSQPDWLRKLKQKLRLF